jgi:uncharacterized protein
MHKPFSEAKAGMKDGMMRDKSKRNGALGAAIGRDLIRYGGEILNSEEMRRAFTQRHHTLSTVGAHTMRVAMTSLAICYALQRLHIRTEIPAVVKGALCHDLGILGRNEKYHSAGECSSQHPIDSVEIGNRITGGLSEKTKDIITRHMWPVGKSKPPNSLEAAIVSTADKIAAVEDFVEGYEEKRPGLRGVIRVIQNRKKESTEWKVKKES